MCCVLSGATCSLEAKPYAAQFSCTECRRCSLGIVCLHLGANHQHQPEHEAHQWEKHSMTAPHMINQSYCYMNIYKQSTALYKSTAAPKHVDVAGQ